MSNVDNSMWSEQTAGRFRVEAIPDSFKPYPHQESAWNAMARHYTDAGKQAGIVVVPTGGGKTKLAERWLLLNHIRQGGRVLWLAHRRSLLVQAYLDFARDAHLAAGLSTLNLIRVSGEDRKWSEVAADDHVVFAMIQSTATEANAGFVDLFVQQSQGKVFVVVDEAHHAAAPSYLRVLGQLKKLGDVKVLGLTATPVRMSDDDNRRLWKLFDHQLIYEVKKSELIERGILAKPITETVRTKLELEREFTPSDLQHLERYGELGHAVLERLAQHAWRNSLIVDHYCKTPGKYGKTIVFAATVAHAHTLAAEFSKRQIAADFVDYTRKDSQSVMNQFRDSANPLVIANVEMLTEGYDAPKTQTVFIARPTRSEALLSQMIGRALRGKQAGGTDEAYLVTFVDTWDEYSPLDTEVFIASGEPDALPDRDRVRGPLAIISAELIAEAYKLVQSVYRGLFDGVYECLPHSWFVWEEETELDLNRRLVLVFDNQREGYDRLQQELLGPRRLPDEITTEFAAQIRRDYFANCTDPLPSVGDLFALLSAHQKQQAVESYTFEEKDRFDPARLAVELRPFARDEQRARLRQIFDNDPVCRLVYKRDFESFEEDVQRAITRLVAGSSPSPLAAPQLVEPALVELRSWPAGDPGYALGRVWDAVTSEKRHFPRGVPAISDCSYSDRPLTNLWGFFRYADRKLVISSTLNSPDVPRFVVEFLMYHEALHADMPNSGHNAEFRQRERRFIPSAEAVEDAKQRNFAPGAGAESWRALADQFLDTFPRRFSVGSAQSKLNY